MPKYKNHQDLYRITSLDRSEFTSFGSFPRSDEGREMAEDRLEEVEEMYPNLNFEIEEG